MSEAPREDLRVYLRRKDIVWFKSVRAAARHLKIIPLTLRRWYKADGENWKLADAKLDEIKEKLNREIS